MKELKTIFAVVLSMVLLAVQIVFASTLERVEKKCKSCCCPEMSCCNRTASAPVQSQPAQTTRTVQTQLQFVAAVISWLPRFPARISVKPISNFTLLPALADVPLFTRNCSFLI